MKKFYFTLLILLFTPFLANASSLNLSSASQNIHTGETYTLSITADPQGDKTYTVKAVLSFPTDLLMVSSFTFQDSWTPLSQPGFNEINNQKGLLIKTGGYPSGTLSPVLFGRVKFIGLKEGTAEIKVLDDSVIFNSQSKNTLTEKSSVNVTITPALKKPIDNTGTIAKSEKSTLQPATQKENGQVVADQYARLPLPNDIPSPDKAWLYTELAFLSVLALIVKYKIVLYILTFIILLIIFFIVKKMFSRKM